MHREAFTRLIALYYSVLPQVALQEKFDISFAFSNALEGSGSVEGDEENILRSLNVRNLLEISRHSPDMRWFHRTGKANW